MAWGLLRAFFFSIQLDNCVIAASRKHFGSLTFLSSLRKANHVIHTIGIIECFWFHRLTFSKNGLGALKPLGSFITWCGLQSDKDKGAVRLFVVIFWAMETYYECVSIYLRGISLLAFDSAFGWIWNSGKTDMGELFCFDKLWLFQTPIIKKQCHFSENRGEE